MYLLDGKWSAHYVEGIIPRTVNLKLEVRDTHGFRRNCAATVLPTTNNTRET